MRTHEWRRVNRNRPCSICGKPDWCTFTAEGTLACCMRVQSDKPMANGGWAHRLAAGCNLAPNPHPHTRRERPRRRPDEIFALHRRWADRTSPAAVEGVAAALGVTAASLGRLGSAWAEEHGAWAFPMFDAHRQMIGIRLRGIHGRKWAVKGSKAGLFWPDGVPGEMRSEIVICEGPTDAAALLDLGFDAIGRPSCSGGVDLIAELLSEDSKDVIILADADGPGLTGAKRLAESILEAARSVRIIRPHRGKDARDWVRAGATRAIVETVIRNAKLVRRAG